MQIKKRKRPGWCLFLLHSSQRASSAFAWNEQRRPTIFGVAAPVQSQSACDTPDNTDSGAFGPIILRPRLQGLPQFGIRENAQGCRRFSSRREMMYVGAQMTMGHTKHGTRPVRLRWVSVLDVATEGQLRFETNKWGPQSLPYRL